MGFFDWFTRPRYIYSTADAGRFGELKVSETLDALPPSFRYLENINLENRGDIDRIVIGPTGIWALEVKNHIGEITYDGTKLLKNHSPMEKDHLGQVWAETKSISKLLQRLTPRPYNIQPVIVYCNKYSKVRFGFKPVNGVYIIRPEWLSQLIQNTTVQRLTYSQVDALTQIISGSAQAIALQA